MRYLCNERPQSRVWLQHFELRVESAKRSARVSFVVPGTSHRRPPAMFAGETIDFVYLMLDPFMNKCWNLCAID